MNQPDAQHAPPAVPAQPDTLSHRDVDRGYAEIPVQTLDGRPCSARLNFPTWRESDDLNLRFFSKLDSWVLVEGCKPGLWTTENQIEPTPLTEKLFSTLDPDSRARIQNLAALIVIGEVRQKKMRDIALRLMPETLTRNGSDANIESLPPVIQPQKSDSLAATKLIGSLDLPSSAN